MSEIIFPKIYGNKKNDEKSVLEHYALNQKSPFSDFQDFLGQTENGHL